MAIKFAEPKDIVLVAGKGHETYQEINGVKHHFDDKETIRELLQLMGK
jgi:UDP-N-acetylmuramoyl-L-alanyl-D-glutamate--2,6-diaminopimelate ligase